MKKMNGVITALITPFKDKKVDFDSLKKLVDFQIKSGVQGFVINGTTGESPTVSLEEMSEIFSAIRKQVGNAFPLIFGAGSNSTQKAIALSKAGEKLGADAILSVVPYYNKPTQKGLFEHFVAIASSINIPVILYNVPGRTITA